MAPILHRLRWRVTLGGALLLGLLVGQAMIPVRAQPAAIQNNNNAMGLTNFIDANRYHNFGTALGGNGFGIRENAGAMQVKDDGGAWAAIAAGAGFAPVGATYITQTVDATLTNEQALDALASGIMRVDTAAGVITSLTDSAGIAANVSDETGTGVMVFGTAPTFTTSIDFGATTVQLSAAAGVLTIAGIGGAQNENVLLDLETTANQATWSTLTGVNQMNFAWSLVPTTITFDLGSDVFEWSDVYTQQIIFGLTQDMNVSSDGDGAIIFESSAGGFDEDLMLNLDDVENEATWTSSTGVATWNFTAADARITAEESVTTFVVLAADPNSDDGVSGIYWDDGDNFELGVLTSPTDGTTNPLYTIEFATGNLLMDSLGATFVVGGAGFIDYGTNGVRLSADLDGAYVWLGLGDGFDESITWNLDDVENTVGVTSTTGVTAFNFESIGLQESGNAVPNATDNLGFFGATTSAQFFGVISDETGGTLVVGSDSPVFTTQFDLEAAGVRFSAANGVLTLQGIGDGADEDLILDFNAAAPRIHITGASIWQFNQGQTLLSTGSLALEASGQVTIRGNEWIFDADDFYPNTADAGNDIGTLTRPVDRLYVLHRINASGISAAESYKWGLGLSSSGGDPDNDVDVADGAAQSFDTTHEIEFSAQADKQLDAQWATGAAAGMLGVPDVLGADNVTFNDNGGAPDTATVDAGTPFAGCSVNDKFIVTGSVSNNGVYPVTACTSDTEIAVATGSFVAEGASSAEDLTFVLINTWYGVALIEDGGVEDICADVSEIFTNCLARSGYDQWRFLQMIRTDGDADIQR